MGQLAITFNKALANMPNHQVLVTPPRRVDSEDSFYIALFRRAGHGGTVLEEVRIHGQHTELWYERQ